MFYCEKCRDERCWPKSMRGSNGGCEICGKAPRACYDIPSCALPFTAPKGLTRHPKTRHCHGANTGLTAANVRKLMRLQVDEEIEILGILWTRMGPFEDPDTQRETTQYKMSPHGGKGDFDKDADWVYRSEVVEDHKAFKAATEAA